MLPYYRNHYRRNPDQQIVDLLKRLLANTYLLYIQTQGAHWNVVGSDFPQLHTLFQTQYEELSGAVDTLAEHIRTYGAIAPASAAEFLQLATLKETQFTKIKPLAGLMDLKRADADAAFCLTELLEGHRATVETARKLGAVAADEIHTENLAAERIDAHNKAIWMIEATLNGSTSRPPRRMRRYNPCGTRHRPNPWTAHDVKRFNKRCAGRARCRTKWPKIANAVLREHGDEGRAIRIANWQTKRMGLRRFY